MNKSDHTSTFPVEWGNTIQKPGPFYLSSQSSRSSKHDLLKIQVILQFSNSAKFSVSSGFRY